MQNLRCSSNIEIIGIKNLSKLSRNTVKSNIAVWGLKRGKTTIVYVEYLKLIHPDVEPSRWRFLNEPFSRIHTEPHLYAYEDLYRLLRRNPVVVKHHLEHTQHMSDEDLSYFKSDYDNILVYTSDWFDMLTSFCLAVQTNEWQVTQDKTEGLDKYDGKSAVISIDELDWAHVRFKNFLTYTPDIQWNKVYNVDDLYVDSWFSKQKPHSETIINYDNLREYYNNNFDLTWQIGDWKLIDGKLQYPDSERIQAIQDY